MRLSGAQSPFARSGRYPSRRDFQNLVGRHYPAFLAPTDSCADPKPSSCLGKPSYTRSLQVAVSPCWESDLPGVSSANLSSRAWTPTPAALVVHLPVSSHKTTAFPTLGPGRRDRSRDHGKYPYSKVSTELFTRLQSFTHVQARGFARHPDCSYRRALLLRSLSNVRRVRWVAHRFRSGPQSDSHRSSQLPAAHRAAVASTSPPISVRYLPEQGIC
jgi:hypothetical protein